MKAVLAELGLPATGIVLADGSGLSRTNRLDPALLTALLAKAADGSNPALSPIFSGLPVAAWSGTLTERFRAPRPAPAPARSGRRPARLTGVNAMSGIVTTADGRLLAFAMLADRVPARPGRRARGARPDRGPLATCGCR